MEAFFLVIIALIVFGLSSKTDTNPIAMLFAIPFLALGLGIVWFVVTNGLWLLWTSVISLFN